MLLLHVEISMSPDGGRMGMGDVSDIKLIMPCISGRTI